MGSRGQLEVLGHAPVLQTGKDQLSAEFVIMDSGHAGCARVYGTGLWGALSTLEVKTSELGDASGPIANRCELAGEWYFLTQGAAGART